jgi:DMSO/TMAO reductase YedYZ molybdopterin-dependent catalytic subunit
VTLVVAAGLAGGYAWVVLGGVPSLAGFTVMTLHAWAGLALVPIVTLHLLPRRWTILRPGPRAVDTAARRVSRRSVLAAAALGGVALVVTGSAELLDRSGRERRRFTGSRPLNGATIPPATTFIADSDPVLEAEAWRLRVGGRVARATELSIQDLEAFGLIDKTATLDCTSGWTVDTTWRGVPLITVVEAFEPDRGASAVVVRSATGWSSTLPIDEARGCLLATGVAGVALPSANGAPCRLVVPTRRGLDWVKWVTDVEVV